jgi:hypothetical protein
MGRLLYELASSGPKDWLEIGSWNGLGSTQCILDGFKNRTDDPHLDSFELDPVMFQIAEENLKDHPCIKNVTFHCNALGHAHRQPFPSEESLSKEERECPHFRIHYEREWALYEQATGVIPAVAPEVAVLDGGEYSGYLDWVHLDKTRLHYLILDDTNALKNQRVMAELDPTEWKCLAKENERNGWAAFQRIF